MAVIMKNCGGDFKTALLASDLQELLAKVAMV